MENWTGVLLLALCAIIQNSCGQMVEVDKRDLIAMIDAACPGYCSGRSSSATLQQLCTCPGNPNVFHWGKRNGAGLFNYKNVAAREEATKLDALAATFDEKMLPLLEKTTKQPSSESAGSDVGDQLRQLLEAVPLDAAADVTDKPAAEFIPRQRIEQSTDSNLFVSEFGKTIEQASHEDFMRWTEKEMKGAELRLLKLVKFYEFLRETDPRNSKTNSLQ